MEHIRKTGRWIIIFLVIISLASTAFAVSLFITPKPSYNIVIGVDVLNEGINDENTILIDLRNENDYKAGHIDGAINMPYIDGGIKMLAYLKKKANKNYKLFLMCYHGNRSGMAFNLLRDEGYTNLNYVKFGYEEYVNIMGSKFKPTQGECPCKSITDIKVGY